MALNIQGNIELDNGLTLPSIYARTDYRMNDKSNNLTISVIYWLDKTSFDNSLSNIFTNIHIKGRYAYNRAIDGEDVLLFTQNVIKEELENQGFSVSITDL